MRNVKRTHTLLSWLNAVFPIAGTLASYSRALLVQDSIAALIVTILLIPQSLAYALLAGLPPEVGLYASIIPLMVYAVFGSSHALSVGPVAVVSLMTATALSHAQGYGVDYLSGALTLALLSGVFMLVLGVLRFGFIANLLSHPIVSGFISASALMIALSQLSHIWGVSSGGHNVLDMMRNQWQQRADIHELTLMIGVGVVLFLLGAKFVFPRVLARMNASDFMVSLALKLMPVIAVVATIVLARLFDWEANGVAVVGYIPAGLPDVSLPTINTNAVRLLMLPAVLIALIGYVESVAVGKTLASRVRKGINPNQELIALGGANIAAAFSGGFPVTGGFSRSVVNLDAGAATQVASVLTALGILCATVFLTPVLYFLPKATLAVIIIMAVLSLVDRKPFIHAWQYAKTDFIAIVATFVLTLFMGVEVGVLSGVAVAIALHIIKTAKLHIAQVGLVPNTEHFRNVDRHEVMTHSNLLSLRPDESLYFINADALAQSVYDRVAEQPDIQHVVIQCSAINDIDLSALHMLEMLNTNLLDSDVTLHLSEVKGPVMDKLLRSGFLPVLSGDVFFTQFEAHQQLSGA